MCPLRADDRTPITWLQKRFPAARIKSPRQFAEACLAGLLITWCMEWNQAAEEGCLHPGEVDSNQDPEFSSTLHLTVRPVGRNM